MPAIATNLNCFVLSTCNWRKDGSEGELNAWRTPYTSEFC